MLYSMCRQNVTQKSTSFWKCSSNTEAAYTLSIACFSSCVTWIYDASSGIGKPPMPGSCPPAWPPPAAPGASGSVTGSFNIWTNRSWFCVIIYTRDMHTANKLNFSLRTATVVGFPLVSMVVLVVALIERWNCDRKVAGSTPGQGAIKSPTSTQPSIPPG